MMFSISKGMLGKFYYCLFVYGYGEVVRLCEGLQKKAKKGKLGRQDFSGPYSTKFTLTCPTGLV